MRTAPLLLLALLGAPHAGHAQGGSIEVAVTDTLVLPFSSLTYRMEAGETSSFMGIPMPDVEDDPAETPPAFDLEVARLLFQRNGFAVRDDASLLPGTTGSWPMMKKEEGKAAILIEVEGQKKLGEFAELLKGMKGYTGTVSDVRYESPDDKLTAFHARVMARARKEADAIAAASRMTLGRVVSVSEITTAGSEMGGYMQLFERMMKRGFESASADEALRKEVVRTMRVGFAAE